MRCYVCNQETDRWPDSICEECAGVVEEASYDEGDPEVETLIPYSEAFDFDDDH